MPGVHAAAKRYAQAAFEIARERGTLDRWAEALESIALFMTDPRAEALLTRSKMSFAEKAGFLERSLPDIEPLALNMAKLLIRKNRTTLAPFIAEQFRGMADAERGIVHAQVRTAVPLDSAEQEALAQRLSALVGRSVDMRLEIDPTILGGIVARIGDEVIDGSTKGKLMALRRRLQEAAG